jgi:hypothetical protein
MTIVKTVIAAILTLAVIIIGLKVLNLIAWGLWTLIKLAAIILIGLAVFQAVRKALD